MKFDLLKRYFKCVIPKQNHISSKTAHRKKLVINIPIGLIYSNNDWYREKKNYANNNVTQVVAIPLLSKENKCLNLYSPD